MWIGHSRTENSLEKIHARLSLVKSPGGGLEILISDFSIWGIYNINHLPLTEKYSYT